MGVVDSRTRPAPRICVVTATALRCLLNECRRLGARREACAVLFGDARESGLCLDRARPIPNRSLSPTRFRVRDADIAAAAPGRRPRALFHSHPASLYPSPADLRGMANSTLLWLIGVVRAGDLRIRAYANTGRRIRVVPTRIGGDS